MNYWQRFQKMQPLDRVAVPLIILLTIAILILILSGDHTVPRVREFSWENRQVNADDTAFVLTFNRPMNRPSVEDNLKIDPQLPGKVSWAGRNMVYTLLEPAPYGNIYQLSLQDAFDIFAEDQADPTRMQPFNSEFSSRDRALVYIGAQGEENGRIVLVNLTRNTPPQILTPKSLTVLNFKIYPDGDRILFSALERNRRDQGLLDQKLFTVTTGVASTSQRKAKEPGELEVILNSQEYQNLKFDLSDDGKTIVIERVNRQNSLDSALWVLTEGEKPYILKNDQGERIAGGNFLIAPDSQSLVLLQGEGTAIFPLKPEAPTLEFLPKFGNVLNFTRDGQGAAMVKFNPDGTQSLFLVTNQSEPRELLRTRPYGKILKAEFDPSQTALYCLLTQLVENPERYQEQPYLAVIDLATADLLPLVILPDQQGIEMSLSPDGLGLLFDQTVMKTVANATETGKALVTSRRLWLLPLAATSTPTGEQTQLQPEELPLAGFHPRWMP